MNYGGTPRDTDDDLFLAAFPRAGQATGRDPVVALYRAQDIAEAYYWVECAPPRLLDTSRPKGQRAKRASDPPIAVAIGAREGALQWLRSQLKDVFPELVENAQT